MKISPEKFKTFKREGFFSIPGKWYVGQVVNVWADNCGSRKAKCFSVRKWGTELRSTFVPENMDNALLQRVNGY